MSKQYDLDLSKEAQSVFDGLGGGLSGGGELFRSSGITNEDLFVKALRELADKGFVNIEGKIAPSEVMLTVISARPSAYEFLQRAKRAK